MTTTDKIGSFGKHEMDQAALEITKRAVELGSWSITVTYESISDENKAGFLLLLAHGWFEPMPCRRDEFFPRPEFIARAGQDQIAPFDLDVLFSSRGF